MQPQRHLIVVLGPTAVGKTATCITLSQTLQADIISADSRQCYQKVNIGVAKPTPKEQQAAPHHLIDYLPLTTPYSAGQYAQDALHLLQHTLWKKSPYAILTGGSGLYIQALCHGIPPMPHIPTPITQHLQKQLTQKGLPSLLTALKKSDPTYYHQVDKNNPKRIIRALAIHQATQKPFTFFRTQKITPRPFNIIKIGLQRPRQELYQRINQRVDLMIQQGLWEEATALYPYKHLPSMATIGYQEIFASLDGQYNPTHAITQIKQNTRRYAKRQTTWFRKDPTITWFQPTDIHKILAHIEHHTTPPTSPTH